MSQQMSWQQIWTFHRISSNWEVQQVINLMPWCYCWSTHEWILIGFPLITNCFNYTNSLQSHSIMWWIALALTFSFTWSLLESGVDLQHTLNNSIRKNTKVGAKYAFFSCGCAFSLVMWLIHMHTKIVAVVSQRQSMKKLSLTGQHS